MKQPKIEYEGTKYLVEGMYWDNNGTVDHVVFRTDEGIETAFNVRVGTEEGRQENGVIYLDIKKRIKGGE